MSNKRGRPAGERTRSRLSYFVEGEVAKIGYIAFENKTGVSKGAQENLIRGTAKMPSLETIAKIADGYNIPAWQVLQWAGFDPDLPDTADARSEQIVQLVNQFPDADKMLAQIAGLEPDEFKAVLMYLEVIERQDAQKRERLMAAAAARAAKRGAARGAAPSPDDQFPVQDE
jgi:transcriptional regulator with XRE-family HTH domain